MKDKLLKDLEKAIKAMDQMTLFDKSPEQKLQDACIAFLKYNGYRVTKPIEYRHNVRTLPQLVELFYLFQHSRNPDYIVPKQGTKSRDHGTARRFIDSRKKACGYSEEVAIKECAEIINTVFTNYADFRFKFEPTFDIFGQAKCGWITDKAIQIINKKLDIIKEEKAEIARKKMLEEAEDDCDDFDLDAILEGFKEDRKNGK